MIYALLALDCFKKDLDAVNLELITLQEEDDETGSEHRLLATIKKGTRSRPRTAALNDTKLTVQDFIATKTSPVREHEKALSPLGFSASHHRHSSLPSQL